MKKSLTTLSLVIALGMMAMLVPLLGGGGTIAVAAGTFEITDDGELVGYNGSGGTVTVPGSVTRIGIYAFSDSNVTKVILPDSVTSIGEHAFSDCRKLTSVSLPHSITSIEECAFAYCESLQEIVLPDSLTVLSRSLLEGCEKLKSVTLPASLTSIEESAFNDCESLEKIDLPDHLKTIGVYAFAECQKLTSVSIPASVTKIKEGAFEGCGNLQSVEIPLSVKSIGEDVFYNDDALTDLYYGGTRQQWDALLTMKNGSKIDIGIHEGVTVHFAEEPDEPLSLLSHPLNVTAGVGYEAVFSVAAVGNGLTYQWYYQKKCSSEWTVWQGAAARVVYLTLDASWDGAQVRCRVSDNKGETLTSSSARITIDPDFVIIQGKLMEYTGSGENVTIPDGVESIELSAFEACAALKSVVIPDTVKSIGEVAFVSCSDLDSISIPASVTEIGDGAFSNCSALKSVEIHAKQPTFAEDSKIFGSSPVETVCYAGTQEEWDASRWSEQFDEDFAYRLVLNYAGLAVTAPPESRSILLGEPLTLSVQAVGNGLRYQWYFKKAGQSAFSVWNGHTHATETCTPNATWDGIRLYCRVTDSAGHSVNSEAATIRVLSVSAQPKSQTIQKGAALTLSVKATGGGLTYQWYFKKKGQTAFSVWNGHTKATETCTPNDTWDGIQLYCVVKDDAGHSVKSDAATITFAVPIAITAQPTNQTVTLGKPVTVSLKATGEGLTYQWYFKKKGQTAFSVWNGHTKAAETCTPNATWDGIQLYCVVKDSAGNAVQSKTVTVTVKAAAAITTQPTNQTIILGQSVTVSLKATGEGLTYQWYFKKKGQTAFSAWNGHTKAAETCTPNATWDGIQLYCVVKDSAGNAVQSKTVTVTVKAAAAITTQPTNQTIILGQAVTVSLKATGEGLTYQWYFKKKGQTAFSPWNGHTKAAETCTPNATWDGIQLYCLVKDSAGNSVKSNTITVTVKAAAAITTQPTNQTITLGQPVTVSLKATGEGLTYQWYFKKKGQTAFSAWNGHTKAAETCTPNATWDGIQLYCVVKDSAGNAVQSKTITVTVNQ